MATDLGAALTGHGSPEGLRYIPRLAPDLLYRWVSSPAGRVAVEKTAALVR